jgi:hypothetical protein
LEKMNDFQTKSGICVPNAGGNVGVRGSVPGTTG